jgi:2-polyprenyl-6-methoxyphenol hydroxylase-like FAD-dependent oxidoreductase
MSSQTTRGRDADVVVVGAGPTGLLLAGDLAEAGLRVRLLEKRDRTSNLTRAFAVHARTLEQLDARGLADDLVATGTRVEGIRLFGGIELDVTDLPTRFPFVLITPQYHVERLLGQRADTAGVELRRGAEVVSLEQDRTGVTVTHRGPDGSRQRTRASYVVGTDGFRSRVRQLLGLPFPGRSALRSLMLADVRFSDPPTEVITVSGNERGFAFIAPFGDGWFRVIARRAGGDPDDDVPVALEEIREAVREVFGHDFGMGEARWTSRFHSDERQAPRYRVGRVLLAGDAAHVHSPAGGMGMNTGLQDAADLGWRLALAVRHDGTPVARAVRNTVVPVVLRSPVGRRGRELVSGIGIRYPAPPGEHPLVGTRAPDVTGGDGTRLAEALRGVRFVLVTPDAAWASRYDDRLAVLVRSGQQGSVLVRPDGYVAWVGAAGADLDPVLGRWGLGGAYDVEPARSSAVRTSAASSLAT